MDLSVWNFLATLALVLITTWYAISTARMLREMKAQADAVREQSSLLAKSAQIVAWAALMNAAGHPTGQNPFEKVRELVGQLEKLESSRLA